MNQFKYSNDNKRYHTFNYYLKNKYHCKVAKVGLNAGFTCPNRDGSKGVGGCIFCSDSGSGDFAGNVHDSLQTQFNQVSQILSNKWPGCKYIAYFQANTNTYGPVEKIKKCVEPFINKKDVVAISIATRPDCLNDDVLEYLKDVNSRCDLWVELGLQTIHEKTSKLNIINEIMLIIFFIFKFPPFLFYISSMSIFLKMIKSIFVNFSKK